MKRYCKCGVEIKANIFPVCPDPKNCIHGEVPLPVEFQKELDRQIKLQEQKNNEK